MNKVAENKQVRIKMDQNLINTGLENEYGVVIQTDGVMSQVMMISGKEVGKTHRFLSLQLISI